MTIFMRCLWIFFMGLLWWPLGWFFAAFFVVLDIYERRQINRLARSFLARNI